MANVFMNISLAAPPDAIIHTENWQVKTEGLISGQEHPEMMTLVMAPKSAPAVTTCPAVTMLTSTRRRVPTIDFSTAMAPINRMLKHSSGVRKNTAITEL